MSFTQPMVRQPQALLSVGGSQIVCISAEVSNSRTRKSDTFNAELSLTYAEQNGMDLSFWSSEDQMNAELIFTDGDMSQLLLSGQVDEVTIDLVDRIVKVSGRDASAKLSETRFSKKYNNQSVEDIVSEIAGENGLSPVIETNSDSGGQDDAGKKYKDDTTHLVLNKTYFEVLSDLAEREGSYWYVLGQELHFVPKDNGGDTYDLVYQEPTQDQYESGNFIKLTLKRNLRASQNINVNIKSWHSKDAQVYTGQAQGGGGGSDTLTYNHEIPMLNQDQVNTVAQSKLSDYTRHAYGVTVEMPGDLSLTVEQQLNLSGTDSEFDQAYDIDHIEWRINEDGGFEMTVEGKTSGQSGGSGGGGSSD